MRSKILTQDFMALPLTECVLRCDPYLSNINGGTYGYTRQDGNGGRKFHGGIDLYAKEGTPCFSLYRGKVEWVMDFGKKGWGKAILAQFHFPQWSCWALYAHLSEVFVKQNSPLQARTLIGSTGVSGNGDSNYPHLHLEIWTSTEAAKKGTREKYRIDPQYVLGALPLQPFATDVIERYQKNSRTA